MSDSVAASLPAPTPTVAPGPDDSPSFWTRVSDRLNPVLVREAQQAMRGKTFLIALTLSLAAIVLVAVGTASSRGATRQDGWTGFLLGMYVLLPVVLLIVPLLSLVSMRQEVSAGTVDHLLLTRLSPSAIVRGKFAASLVLTLLFFSLFGPLLALMYLLRGVDVPTVALSLAMAFLWSAGASLFGIALGALGRWSWARILTLVVGVVALVVGTAMLTSGLSLYLPTVLRTLRAEYGAGQAFLSWALPVLATAPLLFVTASASLAHPYENRSSGFRVYALVALLTIVLWMCWMDFASLSTDVEKAIRVAAWLSFPFWLYAVTEDDPLSARVRASIPKNRLLAAMLSPLLPGGARGLLFTALLAGVALATLEFLPDLLGTRRSYSFLGSLGWDPPWERAAAAWAYVVIYASLARFLRRRAFRGPRGTIVSRAAIPGIILGLAVLPHLLIALVGPGTDPSWFLVLDPLEGVRHAGWHDERSLVSSSTLLAVAIGALLVHSLALCRGVGEVLAASKERRTRGAA